MEILSRRSGVSSRTSGKCTFCFGGTRFFSCATCSRNGYAKFRIGLSSCALGQRSRTSVSRPERNSSTAAVLIWRGEHTNGFRRPDRANGSSPLARGTRQFEIAVADQNRFIPAGAGNTAPASASKSRRSVHPRWRGEHATATASTPGDTGSSPLARVTRRSIGARLT